MASDTSLVFNLIARERVSQALERVKERFHNAGSTAGKAFAGLSAGLAPAGAAAVALGGVAASFASAGAAAGAFKAAVVPQLNDVTEAADLYAQAQDAASEGGKEAAAAVKEYKEALAGMPPATRQTAVAFVGLKNDFDKWSDSLSGTTMPIFTKGIGILRGLLPTLTPFVHAATGAIGGFLDRVAAGVKSAGFRQWAADMSAAAGPALTNLLTIVLNLAIGIGGLVKALLPANSGMTDLTGGMVRASEAFARWGAGLENSAGFARFVDMAKTGGAAVGTFAGAALHLLVAISPLLGTTALLATLLANVVSAIPTPALTVLAGVLGAITIGLKLWALYQAAATAATKVATAAQWLWNTALAANPITWVIVGIVALVAAIVILWKKNEGFRDFIKRAWSAILGAFKGVWEWVQRTWPKLTGIFTRPVASAVSGISRSWQRLKQGAGDAVQWVIDRARRLVDWAQDLPGRLLRAVGDVAGTMGSIGRDIVTGIWDGLVGMGQWLYDQLWRWIKAVIPDPIERFLGISSPSKLMARLGVHVGEGLAVGVDASGPLVARASEDLVARLPGGGRAAMPYQIDRTPDLRGPGGVPAVPGPRRFRAGDTVTIVFDLRGADEELARVIRKMVRVKGRAGSVQHAFGRR